MSLPIHISAVQYATDNSNNSINQDKVLHLLDDAAHVADLVLLPAYSFTQSIIGDIPKAAEPVPGPRTAILSQIATVRNAHICYNCIERDGSNYYKTTVLIGADGRITGKQRKISVTQMETGEGFLGGNRIQMTSGNLGRISMLTLDDAGDQRVWQILRDNNVRILLIPGENYVDSADNIHPAADELSHKLRGIARMSGCCVVYANKIGTFEGPFAIGNSMIIGPAGNMLSRGSADQEEVVRTKVTLQQVERFQPRVA